MDGLVKVLQDKEKARSIMKMVDETLKMINTIDYKKFPSNVVKEYYDVLRELVSVILLLDGYKTIGEGAHKKLIEYLEGNYKDVRQDEITLLGDLRNLRNRIAYDGFFVGSDYLERKKASITSLIDKLKSIAVKKL